MDIFIQKLSDLIWSYALIGLCIFSGVYFSIRTAFLQFRYLPTMLKLLFTGPTSDKGISSFQAFSLAISGRVGTGNIVGVATAIAMGGPGAVFWMWAIAILGAASAFIEATLGQVYKQDIEGEYRGGPAYYIEKGLGLKWYGVLFALITIFSCGFLLPSVQSNSIATSVNNAFGIAGFQVGEWSFSYIGLFTMFLISIIIFGGVKRLSKVAEIIVPFMAGAYILMALIIIGLHIRQVPEVLTLIFKSAFGIEQAFSAIVGSAISWGVKRGIYSNEAGQGTAPHAAAASEVRHPAEQGLVQAFSVYIDTFFVCTATAFIILFTQKYNVINEHTQQIIVEHLPHTDYTWFTQSAISSHFPMLGNEFVALALFFFAFTTIMAYYYYAETNIAYIFKNKNINVYIWILRIGFLYAIYFGTIKEAKLAWAIGDIGVGLMAWANVIAILLLSNTALKVWKDYENKRTLGDNHPTFNADEVGVNHTDLWARGSTDSFS